MRRHSRSRSVKQLPLAFNLMANPESKSVLRAAYRRLELSRHLTFEQVMSERAYEIGVRNLADAIVRRVFSGHSTHCMATTNEIATDMAPCYRPDPGSTIPVPKKETADVPQTLSRFAHVYRP